MNQRIRPLRYKGAMEGSISPKQPLRFITAGEMEVEELAWGPHEWLCRPGLTDAKALLLVRVRMPPGRVGDLL
jgi:hypothetical protein